MGQKIQEKNDKRRIDVEAKVFFRVKERKKGYQKEKRRVREPKWS